MTYSFPEFRPDCTSLLKKYLTRNVYENLKQRETVNGFRLEQVIRSGVVNQDSHIGVYAGDAASYEVFSELFEPVICEYHGVTLDHDQPRDTNADILRHVLPDPTGDYILSTRIRVARNLVGKPLGPALTRTERNAVEGQIVTALNSLPGDLAGDYFPLAGMNEKLRQRLVDDHFLFKAGDRFLDAAGLNRDWPEGRGIFHNQQKTFLVWVNEEDQLRIISMEQGGDVLSVFRRLVNALNCLEKMLSFLCGRRQNTTALAVDE